MDDLIREAIDVCCQYDRASASLLQRRLSIGYARAARIIDQLETMGVIASSNASSKPREVLIKSFKEFEAKNGKLKLIEDKEEYKEPTKLYIPKPANLLPDEVKNLSSPLDIPYLKTDFSKIGNLIITGNVISKKYLFLKTYLIYLLSMFDLSKIRLLIDDNTGELKEFNNIPHLLSPILQESDSTLSMLRWLCREMDRRIEIMNKDENVLFPSIVYIGSIFNTFSDEVEDAIKRISSMGAYAGIHLILTGDRLGDFPKMIKDNIPARLEFNKFGENEAIFSFKNKISVKIEELDNTKIKKYLKKLDFTSELN
jgi:DNA segregation ATPase FtsK/SpoIIIE-like protein